MSKTKNENHKNKSEKKIVNIDKDLDIRLRQVAEENGMYVSEVMRQAIIAGLEKFFVESQGSFLKDKIEEVINESVATQMDILRKNLEKRLIGFLALNTNHTLQSQNLIESLIKLEVGFNSGKLKELTSEESQKAVKQFLEMFRKESLGYMKTVYEKNKKEKELELAE